MKDFLSGIVEQLEIVNDRVRVAALSFSNDARVEFHLNTYNSKQDVQQAIRNIQYSGGRTNLASALEMARTQIFQSGNGDRQNVPVSLTFTLIPIYSPQISECKYTSNLLTSELHLLVH